MQKDSFPGCYDISSAGHIPAGDDYIPSAIRELKEELNVTVQESDLIYCGQVHKDVDSEFHRQPFHDHQISNVYLLWLDREAEEFELQTEEIESVRWMDYAQVRGMVASDTLPNCIIWRNLTDRKALLMILRHMHITMMQNLIRTGRCCLRNYRSAAFRR